ncbi:hypothetical protein FQN49_005836, partial [Arthroderma sp. PD_2]
MEPGWQIDVLRLFRAPDKWRPSYLDGLNIEIHDHASAAAIFGSSLLPKDDDPMFETLARDFTEPTKEQIWNDKPRLENPFFGAFSSISQRALSLKTGTTIVGEPDKIALNFIRATRSKCLTVNFRYCSTPFQCHLYSLKVSGKLTGVGTYHRRLEEGFPVYYLC